MQGDVHYFFSLPDALSNVDYVFEAAVENLELKQSLFKGQRENFSSLSPSSSLAFFVQTSALALQMTSLFRRAR